MPYIVGDRDQNQLFPASIEEYIDPLRRTQGTAAQQNTATACPAWAARFRRGDRIRTDNRWPAADSALPHSCRSNARSGCKRSDTREAGLDTVVA
jgi:hypothetical protein